MTQAERHVHRRLKKARRQGTGTLSKPKITDWLSPSIASSYDPTILPSPIPSPLFQENSGSCKRKRRKNKNRAPGLPTHAHSIGEEDDLPSTTAPASMNLTFSVKKKTPRRSKKSNQDPSQPSILEKFSSPKLKARSTAHLKPTPSDPSQKKLGNALNEQEMDSVQDN